MGEGGRDWIGVILMALGNCSNDGLTISEESGAVTGRRKLFYWACGYQAEERSR